ncbi:achaete-scute complex protein T8-like [Anopheles marshallii]|uniref:achaete-scute complex protein T8-like n=1 Tax=Anopheles marshallii TaxID=1521116 RepID=UPI00237B0C40|nr:achaete-scute complex protein T8-like [Anopheles marshallii]
MASGGPTSLNPPKRMKLKENQMVVAVRDYQPGALKRKLPLGNYVSADNVLPTVAVQTFAKQLAHIGAGVGPGRKRSSSSEPRTGVSAVERRNARERNRVQQVNNGFAALRQRIPDEIAEAFEAGTTARGVHKKLSKVETLRMAVEYIKSLERLLEHSGTGGARVPTFNDDTTDTQLPATPPPEPVTGQSGNFFLAIKPRTTKLENTGSGMVATSGVGTLDQTQITIINGHQYMRIPGTNTFQYLDPESLHDEDDSSTERAPLPDEEEDTCSSSGDLLSESAIALSPQSNFTLEPDTDSKRDVDSLYHSIVSQPDGSVFDQQQYDDLMLIKSELQDEADLAEDASFLSWFEANQQLQLQHQLQQHLQQQLQTEQSLLD